MSAHDLSRGRVLGEPRPVVPELTVYAIAAVHVREGGQDVGDATHHLCIELPAQGREIRIPYNRSALRRLAREAGKAGGIAQPGQDDTESEQS